MGIDGKLELSEDCSDARTDGHCMGIEEKLERLEDGLARTQKNKARPWE